MLDHTTTCWAVKWRYTKKANKLPNAEQHFMMADFKESPVYMPKLFTTKRGAQLFRDDWWEWYQRSGANDGRSMKPAVVRVSVVVQEVRP